MKEREWSKIDFRKSLNVLPVAVFEIDALELVGEGRKQCYGANGMPRIGGYG